MKDLPKVFEGKIKNEINNTQKVFYGGDREVVKRESSANIIKKINSIFSDTSHVYKSKVKITFNDSIKEKVIVGKTNTNLITIDGELIKIIDILDIEKI